MGLSLAADPGNDRSGCQTKCLLRVGSADTPDHHRVCPARLENKAAVVDRAEEFDGCGTERYEQPAVLFEHQVPCRII